MSKEEKAHRIAQDYLRKIKSNLKKAVQAEKKRIIADEKQKKIQEKVE